MDGDEVIRERLRRLHDELAYLKSERDALPSLQAYTRDPRLKRAVERSLQVAVEICLDIGRRLIALRGWRYPQDNKDVFQVLYEEGVISEELLPALVNMARFRNLIVHDYARIDDALVYAILKKHLDDFDAYAKAISRYLQST